MRNSPESLNVHSLLPRCRTLGRRPELQWTTTLANARRSLDALYDSGRMVAELTGEVRLADYPLVLMQETKTSRCGLHHRISRTAL
jgi:hypothetical protein